MGMHGVLLWRGLGSIGSGVEWRVVFAGGSCLGWRRTSIVLTDSRI